MVHPYAPGSPGTKPPVAMRILVIADYFLYFTFVIQVYPAGTFPETNFAISRITG
jgi:hypothetical protein